MDLDARRRLFPPRQALLFLAAVVAPCVLLVGLSLRMLAQERELADRRIADDRRRLAADVRQELVSRLDRLRLEALDRHATPVFNGHQRNAIALVADIENDRLVLPWDKSPEAAAFAAAVQRPGFADAIAKGEREELVTHQFDAAVESYRRAFTEARLPSQIAFAQLLVARALGKAGRPQEAHVLYREVLRTASRVVDEQGIPLGVYAARRLLASPATLASDRSAILDVLRSVADSDSTLAPAAIYMLNDVARELAAAADTTTARQAGQSPADAIPALLQDVEQALAVQNALPTLLAKNTPASQSGRESTWLSFGEAPRLWLIGIAPIAGRQTLVAVRAAAVFGSLQTLPAPTTEDGNGHVEIVSNRRGEPLGDNLPGLSMSFPETHASALAGAASLQRSFYLAALGLVVSMTLFGGYLFWRDVRREVRVAKMRSQFVSSVSHELKTPLTAIRMFAETLLMGRSSVPEVRDEYLGTIVSESERLTRLLNNVLDFSKIEQGKKTYRLEPHSLDTTVRAAAKAMAYPLSQQGFDLRVHIDETVPPVAADPDAIEQAILNLLSNAMKYSGDTRVIAMRLTQDRDRAMISVTDQGLGIPLEEQGRIFDRFYRIGGPDRERIPGAGLGLTLVDHVAKAHRGEVIVESSPGEGSTFSIALPLIAREAGEPAPQRALA